MELNHIPVEDGVSQFQSEREHEVRDATIINQKYHLESFTTWSNDIEINYLSDLNGFVVNQYKTWRRENSQINDQTLYNNLMTIRAFLGWCEQRELVPAGLSEKLDIPKPEDPTRHTTIDPARVNDVIDYCMGILGASTKTVLFYLLWHTGIRIGSARALDVDNWDTKQNFLYLNHQPETDTPLKNGNEAERALFIQDERLRTLLDNYVEFGHSGMTDEYDRKPMFPTRAGRASAQTLRHYTQHVTQPCRYTNECPHGKEPDSCTAYKTVSESFRCPSAVSPHPVRRSAITEHLNREVSKDTVSERMNVTRKVLDMHYDERTQEDKARNRAKDLDKLGK